MDKSEQIIARIEKLEKLLNGMATEAVVVDNIRNIAFPDDGGTTAKTQDISLSGGSEIITVPKNPDQYLRIYYRGKVYDLPVYNIT